MASLRGKCGSCTHFKQDERPEYKDFGNCRRYPPQLVWMGDDWGQGSPWMEDDDYCGEHKIIHGWHENLWSNGNG